MDKPSAIKELKMKTFKQRDLKKIFPDIPGKTLIYWAREGLVEWASETNDARGIHREYSLWNLYQIAIVRELAELGVNFHIIREAMDLLFKDFLQGPPVRSMRIGVARRKTKASESKAMEKILFLGKHKIGRGWLGGDLFLEEPSKIGILVEKCSSSRAGLILLDLPVIAAQIDNKVKEGKLDN